jgi:hypothetical protein
MEHAMLAYVFWHWKRADAPARDYAARLRAFHAALAATPPEGFTSSCSVALSGAPWAAAGGDAYEDWYLIHDFAALGTLNEAAISGHRAPAHDAAAAAAAGGTGGLYRLRHGRSLREPRHASWFGKPDGMSYTELFAHVMPLVDAASGALWMRQLTLGPAREFCLQAAAPVTLPAPFTALAVSLRAIWPEPSSVLPH